MMKIRWLILSLLCLAACRQQEAKPQSQIEKDNFILSAEVTQAAPEMQAQLYELAHFNTPRFPVKPAFVFLDMDRMVQGEPDRDVSRLNLVHLAYWKGGQLSWSGSVMVSPLRGFMGFSERGLSVKIIKKGEGQELTFTDGAIKATQAFPLDQPYQTWIELEGARLYLNYFMFPERMALPAIKPGVPLPRQRDLPEPTNPDGTTDQPPAATTPKDQPEPPAATPPATKPAEGAEPNH